MAIRVGFVRISVIFFSFLIVGAFFWLMALPDRAYSDEGQRERYVYVGIDRAKIIRLDGDPSTVIVGNPSVASIFVHEVLGSVPSMGIDSEGGSVSFDDSELSSVIRPHIMLILQGKGYGKTNAIILDREGKTLETMLISVVDNEHSASIYAAGSRRSYVCTAESCQIELRIGDNGDYFQGVSDQRQGKDGLASSQ